MIYRRVIVFCKPEKPGDQPKALKYRNVTHVDRLMAFIKRQGSQPLYANLYDERRAYIGRIYQND